jgi:hypothetical protein
MHLNYISERSITGEDHIYDDVHTVGKNCTVNQTNKKLLRSCSLILSLGRRSRDIIHQILPSCISFSLHELNTRYQSYTLRTVPLYATIWWPKILPSRISFSLHEYSITIMHISYPTCYNLVAKNPLFGISFSLNYSHFLEHLQEFAKIYSVNLVFLPTFIKLCKLKKEFISNSLT